MFESRLAAWLVAIQRVAPRARLGNWGKDLWCVRVCVRVCVLRVCVMLWIFVLCIVVLCLMDCCCFLAVARHTGQALFVSALDFACVPRVSDFECQVMRIPDLT